MINQSIITIKFPQLFDKKVLFDAQKHAIKEYPNESVGLIVNNKYKPMKNIHNDPLDHWKIDKKELVNVKKSSTLQGLIHSHPDGDWQPSKADMKSQLSLKVPFGIIVVNKDGAGNILWFGDQVEKINLEGRPFIHGVYDCGSLIRDYYYLNHNIKIKEYPRDNEWWNFDKDNKDWNLYLNIYKDAGFYEIEKDELKPGDLILMAIRSKYNQPNHGAIYLGGDQILHHLAQHLSNKDIASRWINKYSTHFLRHKKIKDKKK